jgi:hypothetical protein
MPAKPYKRIRTELVEIQTAIAAFVNQVIVIGLIADARRQRRTTPLRLWQVQEARWHWWKSWLQPSNR